MFSDLGFDIIRMGLREAEERDRENVMENKVNENDSISTVFKDYQSVYKNKPISDTEGAGISWSVGSQVIVSASVTGKDATKQVKKMMTTSAGDSMSVMDLMTLQNKAYWDNLNASTGVMKAEDRRIRYSTVSDFLLSLGVLAVSLIAFGFGLHFFCIGNNEAGTVLVSLSGVLLGGGELLRFFKNKRNLILEGILKRAIGEITLKNKDD